MIKFAMQIFDVLALLIQASGQGFDVLTLLAELLALLIQAGGQGFDVLALLIQAGGQGFDVLALLIQAGGQGFDILALLVELFALMIEFDIEFCDILEDRGDPIVDALKAALYFTDISFLFLETFPGCNGNVVYTIKLVNYINKQLILLLP